MFEELFVVLASSLYSRFDPFHHFFVIAKSASLRYSCFDASWVTDSFFVFCNDIEWKIEQETHAIDQWWRSHLLQGSSYIGSNFKDIILSLKKKKKQQQQQYQTYAAHNLIYILQHSITRDNHNEILLLHRNHKVSNTFPTSNKSFEILFFIQDTIWLSLS